MRLAGERIDGGAPVQGPVAQGVAHVQGPKVWGAEIVRPESRPRRPSLEELGPRKAIVLDGRGNFEIIDWHGDPAEAVPSDTAAVPNG